jgi:hypothetical protein
MLTRSGPRMVAVTAPRCDALLRLMRKPWRMTMVNAMSVVSEWLTDSCSPSGLPHFFHAQSNNWSLYIVAVEKTPCIEDFKSVLYFDLSSLQRTYHIPPEWLQEFARKVVRSEITRAIFYDLYTCREAKGKQYCREKCKLGNQVRSTEKLRQLNSHLWQTLQGNLALPSGCPAFRLRRRS